MVWHAIEVWLALLATFTLGCLLGAMLQLALARSRHAPDQEALAEAIGAVAGTVRRGTTGRIARIFEARRETRRREAAAPTRHVSVQPAVGLELPELPVPAAPPLSPSDRDDLAPPASTGVPEDMRPVAPGDEAIPNQDFAESVTGPSMATDDPDDDAWAPAAPDIAADASPLAPDQLSDEPVSSSADRAARPPSLSAPVQGAGDKLVRIKGLGKRSAAKLNNLGVYHFAQIAAWTPGDLAWFVERLGPGVRPDNDDWVGQAARFAAEKPGDDKGEAGES